MTALETARILRALRSPPLLTDAQVKRRVASSRKAQARSRKAQGEAASPRAIDRDVLDAIAEGADRHIINEV